MRKSALPLAAAATLALAPAIAAAADPVPSLDLRGFHAPTDKASGFYLEPASTPATFDWNTAVWLNYVNRPITLRDPTTDEVAFKVISHQITGDFTASVGFGERLALGFDLPVLLSQTGDSPTTDSARTLGTTALPSQAIGDLGLVGKLTLVRPTGGELGGFALALHERFTLPSGDDASFMGEGHVTSETRVLAEYRLVALSLHATAGVKLRAEKERFACADTALASDGSDPCPTRFGHELPFGLGLAIRPQAFGIDDAGRWTWYVETHGYVPLSPNAPFSSAATSELQLGVGARYAIRDVSLFAGVETALVAGVGNAPLRGTLSVAWAPRVHDVDGDGIEDDVDQCRELAEDRDGFQDDDGCPDADNDDDGVPDTEDRCPAVAEDQDGFEDEDGCADLDNDKDGIADTADACPDEAGPANADPKKNGCLDKDPDRDGVEGKSDLCPDVSEDKDGYQDEDGCPEPDNDGDGVADVEDACPIVAGVASSSPKENGCPDPDPDRDTYQGADDGCQNKAEVWNGIDDADGCPDEDAKKRAKPLVVVKEKQGAELVEMSAAVKFAGADVDPASLSLLRALGAELLAHRDWHVAVGVRPSPKGGADEAMKRATAAADALRRFTRRDDAAAPVAWADVKTTPRAAQHGIGWKITIKAPEATPAKAPEATPAKAPEATPAKAPDATPSKAP